MKKKLFITNGQAPGDILMLTAGIRDLYNSCKDFFEINVKTTAMDIWENNPYLNRKINENNADLVFKAEYPLIHSSNTKPYHFIHGFRKFFESKLNMKIEQGDFCCDLHLSDSEKNSLPLINSELGENKRYWIIDAGFKKDFTAKGWEYDRYQQVVDQLQGEVVFVQIGEKHPDHKHPKLKNVIDMIGKTTTRQFINLMYHSSGVITPVSFPMILSTMQVEPGKCLKSRPCIVIAGGREPMTWQAFTSHQYISRCGMLPCCDKGGCWKSRTIPIGDGDPKDNSLCYFPVKTKSGQVIPKCLDMISVEEVVRYVRFYEEGFKLLKKMR